MSSSNRSEPTVVIGAQAAPSIPVGQTKTSPVLYVVLVLFALLAGGGIVAFLMSRQAVVSDTTSQPQIPANTIAPNLSNNPKPVANRTDEVVTYPDTKSEALTADSVRNVMSAWKGAQESKSFASYQACYDPSFVGIKKTKSGHSQSYSYSSWMADRRRMIASAVNLSLDLSNLQIRVQADTAIVEFDQYYRSLRYSDWGPKEITVKMTPAGPKIIREELKASYPL